MRRGFRKGLGKGKKFILVVVGFLFIVVSITILGSGGVLHIYKLYQEKREIDVDNQKLKEKNARLRKEVEALTSDLAYLERIARQELGMVKEGELVYQFKKEEQLGP